MHPVMIFKSSMWGNALDSQMGVATGYESKLGVASFRDKLVVLTIFHIFTFRSFQEM